MKKIFSGVVALTMASAVAAEEPRDKMMFLGGVTEDAWLDHFREDFKAYGPEHEGSDWAIFGVTVPGVYDREVFYSVLCADLVEDNGRKTREHMETIFSSREELNFLALFNHLKDRPIDTGAMKKDVAKAIDRAMDVCSPKIM